MKLITRETDYALRALCSIAKHKDKTVSVAELAHRSEVPRPFLRKILQVLNKKGLLRSLKGRGGGFRLAQKADKLLLTDIMRIFQGDLSLNECSLKKLACPRRKDCILRKKIKKVESYVLKELGSITLGSLLRQMEA